MIAYRLKTPVTAVPVSIRPGNTVATIPAGAVLLVLGRESLAVCLRVRYAGREYQVAHAEFQQGAVSCT